jgi:uncharacterized membrane-anchored protein
VTVGAAPGEMVLPPSRESGAVPLPLQIGVPVGLELLLVLVLVPVLLVPALVVTAFVYRDATDRNSRHAWAWALAAFAGGVVVWVLYFVVRDEVGPGESA